MPTTETTYHFFLLRHSYRGKIQVVPCTMSILKPAHAEDSICLHDRVAKGLTRDIYVPSSADDIRRFLTSDGFTIGIWHHDKLVCARTVTTDGDWVNEQLNEIGEPTDPLHSTALTGYMVVDKEFRGNNVQFLTYFLSETLISISKTRVVSTVAPKNVFSLQNIMRCGFHVSSLKKLYGGAVRYVTKKHLKESLPIWINNHHTISIRNLEEQQRVLDLGNVGYKLINKTGGFAMLFAPMCDEQPADTMTCHARSMIHMP